tara:strand:- start:26 stop:382 length:357 start_codon:yes stop_codon:yes gene_type:complete
MDLTKPVKEAYQRFYDALNEGNTPIAQNEEAFIFRYIRSHSAMLDRQLLTYKTQEDFHSANDALDKIYNIFWQHYKGQLKISPFLDPELSRKNLEKIADKMNNAEELSREIGKRLNTH